MNLPFAFLTAESVFNAGHCFLVSRSRCLRGVLLGELMQLLSGMLFEKVGHTAQLLRRKLPCLISRIREGFAKLSLEMGPDRVNLPILPRAVPISESNFTARKPIVADTHNSYLEEVEFCHDWIPFRRSTLTHNGRITACCLVYGSHSVHNFLGQLP